MTKHELHLVIPATHEDVLMARMAMSGLGMLSGLEVDLIGDLRTVTNECCDCLMGRNCVPEALQIQACLDDGRLNMTFRAIGRTEQTGQSVDRDIAYGVLSTLMPDVTLQEDDMGISEIVCSMPAGGDGQNE